MSVPAWKCQGIFLKYACRFSRFSTLCLWRKFFNFSQNLWTIWALLVALSNVEIWTSSAWNHLNEMKRCFVYKRKLIWLHLFTVKTARHACVRTQTDVRDVRNWTGMAVAGTRTCADRHAQSHTHTQTNKQTNKQGGEHEFDGWMVEMYGNLQRCFYWSSLLHRSISNYHH